MKKVPPPPFSKAMTIKKPVHIPKAPKWEPKPKTKEQIFDLLRGHIKNKMLKPIPPPPFTRAMTIKPPGYIPPAPPGKPRPPKSQKEIMSLLQGHIAKKMRVPPPPFSKAMTIKPPPKVTVNPPN